MGVFDSPGQITTPAPETIEWKEWVPESVRKPENKPLNNYESLDSALNAHPQLVRKLNSVVVKPDENASADVVAKFWRELGAPENADGYKEKVKIREDLAGVFPEDLMGEIFDVGAQTHIPAPQLDKFLNGLASKRKAAAAVLQKELEGVIAGYKAKETEVFGEDTRKVLDRLDKYIESEPLADEHFKNAIASNPVLRSHPLLKKALNELAKAKNPDPLDPDAVKRLNGNSEAALLAERKSILSNPEYIKDPAGPHGLHKRLIAINIALHPEQ